MRNISFEIALVFILSCFDVFGQWNLQTGYDFGFITKQKNRYAQRISFIPEYIPENNSLFSFSIGKDFYYRNTSGSSSNSYGIGTICEKRTSHYKVNYSVYNTSFSLGYQFEISDKSRVIAKLSAEGYVFNRVKIDKSIQKTMRYNDGCNEISGDPDITTTSFIDHSNSYNNRFGKKGNRDFIFPLLTFSLEYRINIDPIDLIFHLGASPERNNLYKNDRVIRGNYIFTGLRLGYTLPQKSKLTSNNSQ